MAEHLILHEDPCSGNCYKIRLTAALLGLPLERRLYDIRKGETRTPEFLANVNANGRIPVLQVGTRQLPESNAACWYLADGSALIAGEDALALMDEHLASRRWFAGDAVSLADISLYAYTHVAEAGGFRLHDYPHVCAWLKLVAALPGYVAMS